MPTTDRPDAPLIPATQRAALDHDRGDGRSDLVAVAPMVRLRAALSVQRDGDEYIAAYGDTYRRGSTPERAIDACLAVHGMEVLAPKPNMETT